MQNDTFLDACTYATCSVEKYGQVSYIPSLAGNSLYLSIFALALLGQCVLGIRYRTWGYMFSMLGGLILEVLGYISRIQLHFDVFSQRNFTNTIIGVTIAPVFFSASVYLSLARIIAVYGNDLSPVGPRVITVCFVLCDIVSIVLQAIGGAITATAETVQQQDNGIHITIAGLASQVASMMAFVALCSHFAWNVRTHPRQTKEDTESLRGSFRLHFFLWSVAVATITILIRCCFRVAELHDGYESDIANDEVLYMILEGAMMIIAVLALTIGHPGPVFGSMWKANGLKASRKNKNNQEQRMQKTAEGTPV